MVQSVNGTTRVNLGERHHSATNAEFHFFLGGNVKVEAIGFSDDKGNDTFELLRFTTDSAIVTMYVKSHEIRALAAAIQQASDLLDEHYDNQTTQPPLSAAELTLLRAHHLDPKNLPW